MGATQGVNAYAQHVKPFPQALSWSAILLGWADRWMTVQELAALAEDRLLAASDDELMLLSELVSSRSDTPRAEVRDLLQRLADGENWPRFFALREWQVVRLRWALAHLDDLRAEDGLETYCQLRELEAVWEDTGTPLDMPLLHPFLYSCAEMDDAEGGLGLTRAQLERWVQGQEQLLITVRALHDAGQHAALQTLAAAFETFQANGQGRLDLLQSEKALLESLNHHQHQELSLRVSAFNAEQLRRRVQQARAEKAALL
nr:DUF2247 family protein [Deinococcus betulae]